MKDPSISLIPQGGIILLKADSPYVPNMAKFLRSEIRLTFILSRYSSIIRLITRKKTNTGINSTAGWPPGPDVTSMPTMMEASMSFKFADPMLPVFPDANLADISRHLIKLESRY